MNRKKPGTVRIIGGRWRGRRLPIVDLPGLRPSGDRGRETLFNWLQPYVLSANCVDLFAGTGVLGLEAASRGAARVILVEKSRHAVQSIRDSVDMLTKAGEAVSVEVIEDDAIHWIESTGPLSVDIVFIDPPFGSCLESRALELLEAKNILKPGGIAYVETARNESFSIPESGWEILREKTLGDVNMTLLKKL